MKMKKRAAPSPGPLVRARSWLPGAIPVIGPQNGLPLAAPRHQGRL